MDKPMWIDLDLFSTPSGEPLDTTLSEMLVGAGRLISRRELVGAMVFLMDLDGRTSKGGFIIHPLAHDLMAKRLRAAADELERAGASLFAPENNRSLRVN